MDITEQQVRLLHHTLGLTPDFHRTPWRNYFVASTGHHDYADLVALETSGLMVRVQPPGFLRDDDLTFVCTDKGKRVAVESLPPAQKLTKYDEYRRNDSCDSFAEWLGITVPEYEYRSRYSPGGTAVRMVRTQRRPWGTETVAGEYKTTKKEAKASYKEALAARRTTRH